MSALSRRAFAAAAALTATTALAGCRSSSRGARGHGLQYLSLAWQKDSVEANKALVAEWNRRRPDSPVTYVQGSWDSVHDQLLTSFEGGAAPDIIHNTADDLTDFAGGGYLADLGPLLPAALRQDIPDQSWDTTRFNGGIYGVPFLQEPRVLIANRALLRKAKARIPTVQTPWTWDEFSDTTRVLSGGGKYGIAWAMKEPVTQSVNLSLGTGGRVFYRVGGRNEVRFGGRDSYLAEFINRQVNKERSAAPGSLGMGGSDTLPGFFAGKYAMVPLGFAYRQQVSQQAPDGFDWIVLPLPGTEGLAQGVSPQTLSIAEDCRQKQAAMEFIAFMAEPAHMARLAKGDWLLPTGRQALTDPQLAIDEHGWRTGVTLAGRLQASPVLGVRGYAEWKDKIATPAFQEFYSGAIGLDALRNKLVRDGGRVLDRYQR
ncbi:extracellular solute-binding protein [Streptomyces sp. N35]|uniref:extracellular solute-binding protein n=1 Tax=Streptomyces sp. N35 TaxID=2795730 RepID=UPI0018F2E35E|nr:extracellular solute-binding protein [Streptomyces sp. N35]